MDLESKIRVSMSKQAYYDRFEINQILSDVEKSLKTLEVWEPTSWKNQQDIDELCVLIEEEIDLISFWNKNDLTNLFDWYQPNGKWDKTTSGQKQEIRVRIFNRLKTWKEYYS